MPTELISQIPTQITRQRSDDLMEVQSPSLGAAGSAGLTLASLNPPLDSGIFTIFSAAAVNFTVNFNSTLPSIPTRFRLTLLLFQNTDPMPALAVVYSTVTTANFNLVLTGPTGNTRTKVFWEALA